MMELIEVKDWSSGTYLTSHRERLNTMTDEQEDKAKPNPDDLMYVSKAKLLEVKHKIMDEIVLECD